MPQPNYIPILTAVIRHGEHYLYLPIPHDNKCYVRSYITTLNSLSFLTFTYIPYLQLNIPLFPCNNVPSNSPLLHSNHTYPRGETGGSRGTPCNAILELATKRQLFFARLSYLHSILFNHTPYTHPHGGTGRREGMEAMIVNLRIRNTRAL